MRVCRGRFLQIPFIFGLALLSLATVAVGQASYTAQVRGEVKDQTGALVPNVTVRITNDATGIVVTSKTDEHGLYILTGLRPAAYTIRAEGPGFRPAEQKNVILQVDQQTSIDFVLHPLGVITTVEVTEAAPLLDTESAAIFLSTTAACSGWCFLPAA
jgi:Carboxypeptidase regulatory-like domain